MKSWQQKFLSYFILASLFITSLTSFGIYVKLRQAEIAPAFALLEQTADFKTEELEQWFDDLKLTIIKDLNNQSMLDNANTILSTRIEWKPEYKEADKYLRNYLKQRSIKRLSTSILTNNGIVVFSTDTKRKGEYQPLQNTATYFKLEEIDNINLNFYQSSTSSEPKISLATPLSNKEKKRTGVLEIDLNLKDLDQIIRKHKMLPGKESEKLLTSQESYLVGRLSLIVNAFISKQPSLSNSGDQKNSPSGIRAIDSRGINRALQSKTGRDMYLNYNQIPVLGVYRWIPKYRFALLVEVPQAEVFIKAKKYSSQTFIGGLLTTLLTSIILLLYFKLG